MGGDSEDAAAQTVVQVTICMTKRDPSQEYFKLFQYIHIQPQCCFKK